MQQTPKTAPANVILGFLADMQDTSPWVPTAGGDGWMTTATLRKLVASGRMLVENFATYRFRATLDGAAVHYTHSLYGIVSPGSAEITA